MSEILKNHEYELEKGNITFFLNSFDEYNSFVSSLSKDKYYYRGQSDPSWPLENSFSRLVNDSVNKNLLSPNEIGLVNTYFNSEYCEKQYKYKRTILEILSEMQHNGVSTRLLDFTECPFIALYFSIKKMNLSDDKKYFKSSIYFLKKDLIKTELPSWLSEQINNDDYLQTILVELLEFSKPVIGNPDLFLYYPDRSIEGCEKRLIKQKGLFIFSGNPLIIIDHLVKRDDLWYKLCKIGKLTSEITANDNFIMNNLGLIKIELKLKINEIMNAFQTLKKMNIDEIELFPDKEGFIRSLNLMNIYSS